MEIEIWKDVTGYDGQYQVSNLGRVKSLKFNKEKILKAGIDSSGYYRVGLYKHNLVKMVTVHQLVAIEFLNHISNGFILVIDHINGDQLNNRLENLRIITHRENISLGQDKKSASSKFRGVFWNKINSKWQSKIQIDGKKKHLGFFNNEKDAADAYNRALNEISGLS